MFQATYKLSAKDTQSSANRPQHATCRREPTRTAANLPGPVGPNFPRAADGPWKSDGTRLSADTRLQMWQHRPICPRRKCIFLAQSPLTALAPSSNGGAYQRQ
jgi:hypothetical protein